MHKLVMANSGTIACLEVDGKHRFKLLPPKDTACFLPIQTNNSNKSNKHVLNLLIEKIIYLNTQIYLK